MRTEEELLVITMEECAELSQACAKILRFGTKDPKTLASFKQEMGDVACMLSLFLEYEWITEEELNECILTKAKKLKKWSSLPIDLQK